MTVFVLGGPGAGKGTQCAKIVEKFGFVHLSAGDLLRAERKSGSAQGAMIEEYIKEGKIVPVEVTIKLLLDAIAKDGGSCFLVDGFPRNTNNLAGWQMTAGEKLFLGGVLFYDVAEEILQERCRIKRPHTLLERPHPALAYRKGCCSVDRQAAAPTTILKASRSVSPLSRTKACQ